MKARSVDPKLLAALGLLVVAAGYLMLIRPQGSRLAEARVERADAEAQLALARQQAASTPTTDPAGGPGAAALAVPSEPALPELLRQLESAARESGLRHTTVTPSPLGTVPGIPGGSVQVTIGATGSRAGAYVYLNRLALLPRLVVVEQVSLNAAGAPSGAAAAPTPGQSGDVNLQLTTRVFTTEAPPAAPAS